MKRYYTGLSLLLISITLVFLNSCKKEKYAPSLILDLEPYVVYYNNAKFVLYDSLGNKNENIPEEVTKVGQIQQYIDLNDSRHLIYSIDDEGNFVTASKLNTYYNYPVYKAQSYTKDEPSVTVTYDESIGIKNASGIDLTKSGEFVFTYKAVVDGESSEKKVILRVYNAYKSMTGQYYTKSVKTSPIGSSNNWGVGYDFGEGKPVKITSDNQVNLKLVLSRLLNNKKLKGSSIRGESDELPTGCHIGNKKEDGRKYLEIEAKGSAIERSKDNMVFDTYLYGKGKGNYAVSTTCIAAKMAQEFVSSPQNTEGLTVSEVFDQIFEEDTITLKTLVVVSDKGNGSIKNLTLQGASGNEIQVPLIIINYDIKRYIYVEGWTGNNGHTDKNGKLWKPLNETNQFKNWSASFKEGFIETMYYRGSNIDIINEAFDSSN